MRRVGSLQQLGLRPRWRLYCHSHWRPHCQERAVGLLAEHESLCQGLALHPVDGAVQGPRLDREGGPGRHVLPRPAEAARRRPAGGRAVVHPQQPHGDADARAHRGHQQGGHVRLPRQQRPRRQRHGQGRLREPLHGRERRGRLHQRLPEAPRCQGEVRPPRPQAGPGGLWRRDLRGLPSLQDGGAVREVQGAGKWLSTKGIQRGAEESAWRQDLA
mmetsp:Transcript_59914/g.175109  ORF Transcript_59914/g.175109 Transcript_59914/m.175109 type:complete len:216 (+) Transcript_59914:1046-1693(+)